MDLRPSGGLPKSGETQPRTTLAYPWTSRKLHLTPEAMGKRGQACCWYHECSFNSARLCSVFCIHSSSQQKVTEWVTMARVCLLTPPHPGVPYRVPDPRWCFGCQLRSTLWLARQGRGLDDTITYASSVTPHFICWRCIVYHKPFNPGNPKYLVFLPCFCLSVLLFLV